MWQIISLVLLTALAVSLAYNRKLSRERRGLAERLEKTEREQREKRELDERAEEVKKETRERRRKILSIAFNIHLYSQLAVEEAGSSRGKAEFQVIEEESRRLLGLAGEEEL